MFSLRPVKKLSATMTMFPRSMSLSTRCEPTKPAPPVTRTRSRVALGIGTGIDLATVPRPRGSDVDDLVKAVDDLACEDPDEEESVVDFFTSISATSELTPDPTRVVVDDDDDESEVSASPSSRIISRPCCVVNPVSLTGRDSYFEEDDDPNAVADPPFSMLAPVLTPLTPLTNAIATIAITAHTARVRIRLLAAYRAMILPKMDNGPAVAPDEDAEPAAACPPLRGDATCRLLLCEDEEGLRWCCPSFVTMRGRATHTEDETRKMDDFRVENLDGTFFGKISGKSTLVRLLDVTTAAA